MTPTGADAMSDAMSEERLAQIDRLSVSQTNGMLGEAVREIYRLRSDLAAVQAERSSAAHAAEVLLKALGWSSGGLGSAAVQIVAERDAAVARAERAEEQLIEATELVDGLRHFVGTKSSTGVRAAAFLTRHRGG